MHYKLNLSIYFLGTVAQGPKKYFWSQYIPHRRSYQAVNLGRLDRDSAQLSSLIRLSNGKALTHRASECLMATLCSRMRWQKKCLVAL